MIKNQGQGFGSIERLRILRYVILAICVVYIARLGYLQIIQGNRYKLKAEAQAKANLVLAQSLTPALVQYEALQRWDGKLPVYNGGGVVPLVNIGSTNK